MRFHVGFTFKPKQLIPFIVAAIGIISGLVYGGVIK